MNAEEYARQLASAERAGCSLELVNTGGIVVSCPTPDAVLALCFERAQEPPGPKVQALAKLLTRGVPIVPGSAIEERAARDLHRWIIGNIVYREEYPETFQSGDRTLERKYGDCDDHAILGFQVARAMGLRARIVPFQAHDEDGNAYWGHVAKQLHARHRWCWAETTLPAYFGEHPLAAKRRLGLDIRNDIG